MTVSVESQGGAWWQPSLPQAGSSTVHSTGDSARMNLLPTFFQLPTRPGTEVVILFGAAYPQWFGVSDPWEVGISGSSSWGH